MDLTSEASRVVRTRLPNASLPLLIVPEEPLARPDGARLRRLIDDSLDDVGALLFRGFSLPAIDDFERFVKAVTPELLPYEFGSTPRSRLSSGVYTSTEYPAHQHIPLHNEQSYTTEWPLKIWFHCVRAATTGGATPLADSAAVYQRLSPSLRERFVEKRLMYVRNYGNGLDLPWQEVFGTSAREEVERFCRRAGIVCEWSDDGELRTRQICQAHARHPRTGAALWFNQAHLFHVSNLEPQVREGLLSFLAEDELPRNVFYGDGTPLEPALLAEIRGVYDELALSFPWCEGDVLLVDNMRVAHGRAPFTGPRKVVVAMAEPYRVETA